jgi:hypothetical protein
MFIKLLIYIFNYFFSQKMEHIFMSVYFYSIEICVVLKFDRVSARVERENLSVWLQTA